MKSKIEKIDYVLIEGYDALKPERKGDVDYNCLAEKINEIIDYLNSQDQKEESNVVHTVGTPMLESTTTCSWDTLGGKTLSDRIASAKPNSFIPVTEEEMKQLSNTQDTPEEWEDRIRDLILGISADRLVSSEKVVAIVQSLLDDREREVFNKDELGYLKSVMTIVKANTLDQKTVDGIMEKLDKLLNSKKK